MLLIEAIHRAPASGHARTRLQLQAQCSAELSLRRCERDHLVWATVNGGPVLERARFSHGYVNLLGVANST